MTNSPQSSSAGSGGADVIGVLRSVHSALDGALGDSDVTHIENDDELREEHPVQWAAQWLAHAIELLGETRTGDRVQFTDPQTATDTRLILADEYENGLRKMEASGYEEWQKPIQSHKLVIEALRFQARSSVMRDDAQPAREPIARIIDGVPFRPINIDGPFESETTKEHFLRRRNSAYYKADQILAAQPPAAPVEKTLTQEVAEIRALGIKISEPHEGCSAGTSDAIRQQLRDGNRLVKDTFDKRNVWQYGHPTLQPCKVMANTHDVYCGVCEDGPCTATEPQAAPVTPDYSPCAYTGYVPHEGDEQVLVRIWGFGKPDPSVKDVRMLYSFQIPEPQPTQAPDARAISDAYSDWAWEKEGQPVGLMLPNESARAGFFAGVKWSLALSRPHGARE